MAYNVELGEAACNEPPQLDLHSFLNSTILGFG